MPLKLPQMWGLYQLAGGPCVCVFSGVQGEGSRRAMGSGSLLRAPGTADCRKTLREGHSWNRSQLEEPSPGTAAGRAVRAAPQSHLPQHHAVSPTPPSQMCQRFLPPRLASPLLSSACTDLLRLSSQLQPTPSAELRAPPKRLRAKPGRL